MAFITESDKIIVRMGAEIVFMEQLIAQLQKELTDMRASPVKKEESNGNVAGSEISSNTTGSDKPPVAE